MDFSKKQVGDYCSAISLQNVHKNKASHSVRRTTLSALLAVLCFFTVWQPEPAFAQGGPVCYGVTDGFGNDLGADTLVSLDVVTGNATTIGETSTVNIEAIAFSADGQTLYAANQGELGTLNLATGAYTAIGTIGGGNGSDGAQTYSDVDGLTYDITTDTLFGSVRRPGAPLDLLIKIDPATGAAIPNAFGPGVDYVEVPASAAGDVDIDDIAADPYTGILYGVINNGGTGGTLVEIDKTTGAITELGALGSSDIEGLGFARDGTVATLYGSTGDNGPIEADNNDLYLIDKTNGASTLIDGLPESPDDGPLRDYESLDCIYQDGVIGDTIWSDDDQDGNDIVDGDDVVLEGVGVNLLDSGGNVIATDTTDANGNYLFEDVAFGTYTVQIDTATLPLIKQGNPAYDPDGGDDDQSSVTISVDDPINLEQDFAYYKTGTIGDTIFHDANGDGGPFTPADGDFALEGVTVTLLNDAGTEIGSAVTDANGNYLFDELALGETYTVVVDPASLPDSKISDPTSDPEGDGDNTSVVTLTSDEPEDLDQDFGYEAAPIGVIGDTIFHDANGDGGPFTPANGDFALEGVTVTLLDAAGAVLETAVTDSNGNYLFDELPLNETYTVVVDPASLPDSKISDPTSDPEGDGDNTSEVTLTPQDPEDLDQDFGYEPAPIGVIGDTIFHDANGDGGPFTPADGDFELEGITVTLLDAAGAVLETAVTDANGNYLFDELPLGVTYTVLVDTDGLPADKNVAPTEDPDGNADSTSEVTLTIDEPEDLDQDFGYAPGLGTIGNQIWHDDDQDGNSSPDGDDQPIADVTVNLLDSSGTVVDTAVTDSGGFYLFEDVPFGTYVVQVDTTTLPAEKLGNPAYDPDGNDDNQSAVTIDADTPEDLDQDFAYFATPTGTIGDQIWHDDDQDGNDVIDGDDQPIANVTVNLLDSSGTVVDTQTTDASGNYLFEDVPYGTYTVQVDTSTLPAEKQDNPAYDPDGGDDNASEVTIDADTPEDLDQDFAYFATGTIGDQIWHDDDQDGNDVIDGDDQPIANVTVNLLDSSGAVVDTAVTDASGNYLFEDVPYGTYTVQIDTTTLPAAKQGNPAYDPDGGNDDASEVTIDADTPEDLNQDFAYFAPVPTGTIGDQIWHDDDQDGNDVLDGDDRPIADVTVNLLDSSGAVVDTAVTDASGNYLFTGVEYGTYTVQIDTTTLPAGKQDNPAYDPDGGNDDASEVTIDADTPEDLDQDFAYFAPPAAPLGSIGDTIFHDADGNGVFDSAAGDFPLEGVRVTLSGPDGTQTATTDAMGNYTFSNLPLGDYTVVVDSSTLPANKLTDPSGDPDGVLDGTSEVTLTEMAPNNPDQDFGYQPEPGEDPLGSIGDTIFHDVNGDGGPFTPADGDFPLEGVTVTLLNADGTENSSTTTDVNGNYSFANLPLGDYTVVVDTASLPDGKVVNPTADPEGDGDSTSSVSLTAETPNNTDQDFGYEPEPTGSIGDAIYHDADGNGAYDPAAGDFPLEDVTVTLSDAAGTVLQTVQTNALGNYTFSGLELDAEYTVVIDTATLPANKQPAPTADPDGGADSTSVVTITTDAPDNDEQDFGYQPTPGTVVGGIGDTIYHDADGNGVYDPAAGDFPLENVAVTLTGPDGLPETTTTDADGNYFFGNLPVGDYTVVIDTATLPTGKLAIPTDDPEGDGDSTASVTLTEENLVNTDQDFGYEPGPVATIGNLVWLDRNNNGAKDANEDGLENITVVLLDADSNSIATTLTDENGNYEFTNLAPGDYAIRVELPSAGFTFSPRGATDENFDSDVDVETGISEFTTLDANENDDTWDAGIYDQPNLNVEKRATNTEFSPGDPVIYEITYFNSGVGEATGVFLNETVPVNTTFVAEGSSAGWSCSDGAAAGTSCEYAIGTLAAGERSPQPVFFVVRLNPGLDTETTTTIDNIVVISDDGLSGTGGPITATDDAVVTVSPTSIEVDFEPGVGGPGTMNIYLPLTAR